MEKLKILVMGLPGAGKTTFTEKFVKYCPFSINVYNADFIRTIFDDWDFSDKGRLRQAYRMAKFADASNFTCICDFICPTEETRKIFNADMTVWIDTIREGRFEDTNKLFEMPSKYDYRITKYNQEDDVIGEIIKVLKGDNNERVLSTKK
jgi:adenylylsulfate kinase